MKNLKALAITALLAMVATACGTTQEELVIEDEMDRNAALATDDGKSFVGMNCCVRDIAKDSKGKLWVGGDFSVVGRVTGGLASIGLTSFGVSSLDRITGVVNEVIEDGDGGMYVAGAISKVGLSFTKNLVHIGADGALDRTFNAEVPAFPIIDAADVNSVAQRWIAVVVPGAILKIDASTGRLLGTIQPTIRRAAATIIDADVTTTSRGLVLSGRFTANQSEFVGTIFMDFDGQELAVMSATTVEGVNPPVWGKMSVIEVLKGGGAAPTDVVYLGGQFNLAKLLPSVGAIQERGVGNVARVRWDANGLRLEDWARFNGEVKSIDTYRTILGVENAYVGGSYSNVSYSNIVLGTSFAKISYDTIRARGDVNPAELSVSGTIDLVRYLVTPTGSALLVSGNLYGQSVGGVKLPAGNIAVAVQANGVWRGAPLAESKVDGTVFDVELIDGRLMFGGNFTVVGVPSGGLLRLNADGEIEADAFAAIRQPDGPVYAVEVHGGYVYVGGEFDQVRDRAGVLTAVSGIIRYSLNGVFDEDFKRPMTNGNALPRVNDIAVGNGKMYIGGDFDYLNDRTNFMTLSTTFFNLIPQRPWEQVDGEVTSIETFADGKFVAIGGEFDSIGGFSTPGVAVIDEIRGRVYENFRTESGANVEVSDLTYDVATDSLYIAYGVGESPLVNRRIDSTIVKRFMNTGGAVARLGAADGRVYVGLASRPMLSVDTTTNAYGPQPESFGAGSTAILADKDGAWIAGRGFKIGDNPVYGPVYISREGRVVVSPSTAPAIPGLANIADGSVGSGTAGDSSAAGDNATPTTSEPDPNSATGSDAAFVAEDPLVSLVDLGLSPSVGRVADESGNIYGFTVGADGTIALDKVDIDKSTSRTFMITKLKPGNKSMTVTFVAPRGMKNLKIKASPSSKSLVCSPGKKSSCTIKGLSPWMSYRFAVEGNYGKKKMTSPKSFSAKPVVSMRRGSTSSLSSIVSKASGSSPKYTTSGGCSLESKNTKLKAPKSKALCVVSVTTTKNGLENLRTVTVKVG